MYTYRVQLRFNPITTGPSIQPKHPFLLYLTVSNILSELSSSFHIMRSFSFACHVGINQYCRFVDFFKNVESGHPEPVADEAPSLIWGREKIAECD